MHTDTPSKSKRNARVSGVSFDPDIWEYLEAEVDRQGHRNRSLVIEKAIRVYRQYREAQARGESSLPIGSQS